MQTFMYNVLFDFTKTNGLFEEDNPNAPPPTPLQTSKHWLMKQGINWIDLGVASSLLVRNAHAANEIQIRVASGSPNVASVQFVVSFGRPVRFGHKRGSPFDKLIGTGPATLVKTTFIGTHTVPHKTLGGWVYQLGMIDHYPPNNNNPQDEALVHRYEFALGIIVKDTNGKERHYGEDPEMDIGL